eukprot:GCRY01000185.1.p1 GENE.GCRY01000185.1~~GCRY01000185.1.p1  ORF type:complete len:189 (-),score=34.83 GCRY01000185.1:43-609(-)
MKTIVSERSINIPDGIKVECKARKVRVTGPRGTLTREFKHIRAEMSSTKKNFSVRVWNGTRKDLALIRTITSHIENMITGVIRGYRYKMRFVYAHFPILAAIGDSNDYIEIRNFMGERRTRRIEMREGVKVIFSSAKDEILIEGNDLEDVSIACSQIHGATLVRNKDIRKFLDGIYVSEKGHIVEEED